ncbi:acetyl/propionyl/methylcrotonyl-CoA carboxylase subunit alpha [Glaciecola sp. MH2013]|uniref:acetyl/propionyl/methylcrotonyl-CoA carboxylase subunit alpha n=1 Tax=Glaciecola sp. MH2013 TaxID=2785524 RepID=UPI00189EDF23|nr:acetyl/propionyl/methylcrotonyl-CoA carboxylase subunit alpha [Glaciecola sp. MH2013]MBF7072945.1 acetyl/propionyl/methylcrotonyl-CoA carboxylase subunit alpha [Glaciecola sp. MH2013]
MIRKILIANRGEIACRVIKTAKLMGISTLAVYSDADANALHVKMADEAVRLGPAPSKDSYLKSDLIIEISKKMDVDAIHPGYGFLSENAEFARACAQNNIIFIGPTIEAIEAMGSKSAAKQIMEEAGVPLVPGYHGDDQDPEIIRESANRMGYPVLLKAAAGGGGKGMRQVWSAEEFDSALAAAKRESMSSFNDDKMLVEKYLTEPRHVEIQVFCDNHKQGVYLFERDCSIQRRHQKVIEEAPAPNLSHALREQMGEAALKAAFAINYSGAGTVEFLLDTDGSFYFMEMNTRLQVEHPVTEMITGEDLVEWQIRVANNEPLPKSQEQLSMRGHAFEARIYAEDPNNEFLPATGTLSMLSAPKESANVRVDTGVEQGDEVSIYYDPMIAKLIVWDESREKALARLATCLEDYAIGGVVTNIDYLKRIAQSSPFKKAQLTTDFIERHEAVISTQSTVPTSQFIAELTLFTLLSHKQAIDIAQQATFNQDPWSLQDNYRSNIVHRENLTLTIGDDVFTVHCEEIEAGTWALNISSPTTAIMQPNLVIGGTLSTGELHVQREGIKRSYKVMHDDLLYVLFTKEGLVQAKLMENDLGESGDAEQANSVVAPMNGTVVDVVVNEGSLVNKGDLLIIVEAMKMEHAIKAPYAGVIKECFFKKGDLVSGGVPLMDIEAVEGEK